MTGDGRQSRSQRSKSSGAGSSADSASKNAAASSPDDDHRKNSENQGVDSAPPGVDPAVFSAIHLAVTSAVTAAMSAINEECQNLRKDIQLLHTKFDDIMNKEITPLKSRLSDVEDGLTHASDTIDHIEKTCLPLITHHVASLTQAHHHEILKIDAHRRKWNVIVHGIDGPAEQDESSTRKAVKDFAKTALKLSENDVNSTNFSACHRLSKKKDAGVIIRFTDLSDRDTWLMGAKNIQTHLAGLPPREQNKKISMSIDLPPQIRPLKHELMQKRKELPLEKKRKAKLRYLTQFPFVELRVEGESPLRPSASLMDITKSTLSIDLNLKLPKLDNGG